MCKYWLVLLRDHSCQQATSIRLGGPPGRCPRRYPLPPRGPAVAPPLVARRPRPAPALRLGPRRHRRFGLRWLASRVDPATRGREFRVKGARAFVRGGNAIAPDALLRAAAVRAAAEARVRTAAGLNMVRFWGGAGCEGGAGLAGCDAAGGVSGVELWIAGDDGGRGRWRALSVSLSLSSLCLFRSLNSPTPTLHHTRQRSAPRRTALHGSATDCNARRNAVQQDTAMQQHRCDATRAQPRSTPAVPRGQWRIAGRDPLVRRSGERARAERRGSAATAAQNAQPQRVAAG